MTVNPNKPAQPSEAPATKRRFRIQKLEQRIAPKKGGKASNHCSGAGDSQSTGTSGY